MKGIEEIIKGIGKLKPVPQVAHKAMRIADNPNSSLSELSDVIVYDQALTANLLRTCNSSYFGLPQKVDSVHQAIALLGMDQVVDLVLMQSGSPALKEKQEGYDLDEGDLWRYSVSSALIAKMLAEKKGSKNNHLVFTAGLLKDIGKAVLNQYVVDSFAKINLLVSKAGYSFREAEEKVIGIDHAELGGMVAEKWGFSPNLVDVIRCHHQPETSVNARFETSIVYLADTLCMMMGIGVGSDGLAYRFYKEIVEELGFSDRDFQEVMAGFGEKINEVNALVGNG